MGISDFYEAVKSIAPHASGTYPLAVLSGRRLAVDISVFLYKYVRSAGAERWIDNFLVLICSLKSAGIRPICVFDGPSPPPEKAREREERRANSSKVLEKLRMAETLRKAFEGRTSLTPSEIEEVRGLLTDSEKARSSLSSAREVQRTLNMVIEKLTKQTLPITFAYTEKAMTLLKSLGVAFFRAEGEAEGLCASMALAGMVSGVLTEDTDVMAYGVPMMVSRLNLKDRTVSILSIKSILDACGWEFSTFQDMCILLGCDYNVRAKLRTASGGEKGCGVKAAISLMGLHRSLEEVEAKLVDPSVLRYSRCRVLFSPVSVEDIWIGPEEPIDENLDSIWRELGGRISLEVVRQAFSSAMLLFAPVEKKRK